MNSVMNIAVSGVRAGEARFAARVDGAVSFGAPGYAPVRPSQDIARKRPSLTRHGLRRDFRVSAAEIRPANGFANGLQGALLDILI